ncbi:MAG: 30S ribosomal protein S3 [Proteobacteria bacterium]|nr:30S ribosomal protein S3 [Pseudomonadota bacterium]MDA0949089.1 30S ribosomal protein S3 [Pseudomonadota bacterium]MDA1083257.1 30S ribosomal protein S3 [Pseudomonadota bacterium]
MGQKVNPIGFRLGTSKKQNANWYAKGKDFSTNLIQDLKVREYFKTKLKNSSISRIELERSTENFIVFIYTSRPGIIIGKRGEEIDNLKKAVEKIVKKPSQINIKEVKKPDLDAQILAEGVAQQLEKRVMFRRAMKRTVQSALRQSAKGVRIEVSGRLNGAEIARTEWYREGRVPLHTLRADIDYATAEALTTYGIIGVKVWVFKGEITEDPYKSEVGVN